jgi:hypothetical protein
MTSGWAEFLDPDAAPLGVAIPSRTHTASYWKDWDDDIFDDWGYFYIFDVASRSYYFPVFTQINRDDGDFNTESFTAFERTFTITHGYLAQGIYKFDVTCDDPALEFIFGAYGNMGSDEDTINTNMTHPYTLEGHPMTLYYNRNVEQGDQVERFFSYFVPYGGAGNTKTYSDKLYSDDSLSLYSVPVTGGIKVYFAKQNDVKELVIRDMQGVSRSDVLRVNGDVTVRGVVDAPRLLVGGSEVMPPGSIISYPVSQAPSGYLMCDGGTYDIDEYSRLAQVLGFTPSSEVSEFRVPNIPPTPSGGEGPLFYYIIKT